MELKILIKRKMTDYKKILDAHLKHSSFMRHLFNKLGKIVTVYLADGKTIRGVMTSIDVVWRGIEIQNPQTNQALFVNWRFIEVIEYEEEK